MSRCKNNSTKGEQYLHEIKHSQDTIVVILSYQPNYSNESPSG